MKKILKILLLIIMVNIPFISFANLSVEKFNDYIYKIDTKYTNISVNYNKLFPLKTTTSSKIWEQLTKMGMDKDKVLKKIQLNSPEYYKYMIIIYKHYDNYYNNIIQKEIKLQQKYPQYYNIFQKVLNSEKYNNIFKWKNKDVLYWYTKKIETMRKKIMQHLNINNIKTIALLDVIDSKISDELGMYSLFKELNLKEPK